MPILKKSINGFIFIELLIILVVVGILGLVIYQSFIKNTLVKKNDSQRIQDVNTVKVAIEEFYEKYNKYPPTNPDYSGQTIFTSSVVPVGSNDWIPDLVPSFLKKVPIDPTGSQSQAQPSPSPSPPPAPPPITLNSSARRGPVSTTSPDCSFNLTVNSGALKMLIGTVVMSSSSITITSATFGGQNLTRIARATSSRAVEMWYLVEPPVGTNQLVFNFSSPTYNQCGASVWNNVDYNNPPQAADFRSASGSGTSATVNVPSATGQVVIDSLYGRAGLAVGPGQTLLYTTNASTTYHGSSYEAGAATTTMSWTWTTSGDWLIGAVPIKPAPAPSSIAVDSVSKPTGAFNSCNSNSNNNESWSHTVSGTNRLLLLTVSIRTDSVTSATYAGTPLTLLDNANASTYAKTSIYYMVNPPIGTNTVAVTFSDSTSAAWVQCAATSWVGVDQTTPFGTVAKATKIDPLATNAPNLNVTSAVGDLVVDHVGHWVGDPAGTSSGPGQIRRSYNIMNASSEGLGISQETATGTTTNMSWGPINSAFNWQYWAHLGVALKPAPPAPPASPSTSPEPSSGNYYLYNVTADRKTYSIWAILENSKDPRIYTHPQAQCKDTPPPEAQGHNYCGTF